MLEYLTLDGAGIDPKFTHENYGHFAWVYETAYRGSGK